MLDRIEAFALRHRDVLLVLWAGLLVQMVAPYGGFLSGDPLLYAAVAKSTLTSGDWLSPSLGGVPYFNKPPLFLWWTAGVFQVLGAGMFAARVAGTVPGLLLLALVHHHARRTVGDRMALVAALVLATTRAFGRNSGVPRLESSLTLCLLAAVLCVELGARRRALLPLFWAAVGIGLLVKGPAGLWPIGIVALTSVLRRTWFPWNCGRFWIGLPILPLLATVWLLPAWLRHGDAFVQAYFVDDLEATALGTDFAVNPFTEYGSTLLRDWLPWFPFALHGAWLACGRVRRGDGDAAWPLAWIAVVVATLLPMGVAYPRYLFPLLPATSLLAAESIVVLRPAVATWRVHRGVFALCAAASAFLLFGPLDLHTGDPPSIATFAPVLRAHDAASPVLYVGDHVPRRIIAAAVFHSDLEVRPISVAEVRARLVAGEPRVIALSPRTRWTGPDDTVARRLARCEHEDLVEITLRAAPASPSSLSPPTPR
ncbi:MAG: glycosyltransferase family 39 protein [Planctomycetes bacterium]|nr:glycosyltransferase family 39 protein [Planctomycetota bacterium]